MAFEAKVYVVQRPTGEIIAVKMAHGPAHAIAKAHAPAAVHFIIADKSPVLNGPGELPDQKRRA